MNVEVVEFHYYYAAVPGPVLLAIGITCLLLAAAGVVLLFRVLKSKR